MHLDEAFLRLRGRADPTFRPTAIRGRWDGRAFSVASLAHKLTGRGARPLMNGKSGEELKQAPPTHSLCHFAAPWPPDGRLLTGCPEPFQGAPARSISATGVSGNSIAAATTRRQEYTLPALPAGRVGARAASESPTCPVCVEPTVRRLGAKFSDGSSTAHRRKIGERQSRRRTANSVDSAALLDVATEELN